MQLVLVHHQVVQLLRFHFVVQKTNMPQGINKYSRYIEKQYYGFTNVLNSAVNTNTSLGLD